MTIPRPKTLALAAAAAALAAMVITAAMQTPAAH